MESNWCVCVFVRVRILEINQSETNFWFLKRSYISNVPALRFFESDHNQTENISTAKRPKNPPSKYFVTNFFCRDFWWSGTRRCIKFNMTDEMMKRAARSGGCRLCLAPDSECISIFSLAADKEPIANKIHSCVTIKVSSIWVLLFFYSENQITNE